MRAMGYVFQVLGALVLLYACATDIVAPGTNTVNMGRVHHSLSVTISGWGMLIFGAVLAMRRAAPRAGQAAEAAAADEHQPTQPQAGARPDRRA